MNHTFKLNENEFDPTASISFPQEFLLIHMPNTYPLFNMVYLYGYSIYYLSRSSSNQQIAEKLGMLESDVIKAWEYWEKKGLVKIIDRKNFKDFNIQFIKVPFLDKTSKEASFDKNFKDLDIDTKTSALETFMQGEVTTYEPIEKGKFHETLVSPKSDPLVKQIIKIAEKELGPLNSFKSNIILGFYYDYHLSLELIEELFKYCKSRRKLSITYIEKVAISWAELGINSLEKLHLYKKEFGEKANKIFKIQSILGVPRDGSYTKIEEEMYSRWLQEYGYTLNIIEKASHKAVQSGNKGNLNYIDGILKKWHQYGVRILSDIEAAEIKIHESFKKQDSSSQRNKYVKPSTLKNFDEENIDFQEIMKIHNRRTAKDIFNEN